MWGDTIGANVAGMWQDLDAFASFESDQMVRLFKAA